MLSYFFSLSNVVQAFIACMITWGITSLGAAIVFFFKKVNKNLLDGMLGLAAGVMVAASFFSLLSPAVSLAEELEMIPWLVAFIGFFAGGLLLFAGDKLFPILIKNNENNSKKRTLMLVLSITLHNIPEGLAIGVAFGSVVYGIEGATSLAALLLAIGIGIQNFPEGTAVSLPLRREGFSRKKAFLIGGMTGVVEPIAGVVGALLVLKVRLVLPFLLAFAAGAMIYVVVEELIPESQSNKSKDLMALFTIIGFSIMMILDVALG
ncbi:MAG: ZIP family metal transporter [Firmicutes bacterium]|nr:ZIP family metal transporter [Bacillota bacterium]